MIPKQVKQGSQPFQGTNTLALSVEPRTHVGVVELHFLLGGSSEDLKIHRS